MWREELLMKQTHGNRPGLVFDDEHIVVGDLGFDPLTRQLKLGVSEKHESVGLYHITVLFESGDFAQINFDGANAARSHELIATTSQPNDTVKEIKVVCARPSRRAN
jgi:hypothetical protein